MQNHIARSILIDTAAVLGLIVLGAGIWYAQKWQQDQTVSTVAMQPVQPAGLDFAFSYPAGEAGYSLIEPPVPAAATSSSLRAAFLLLQTSDYIAYQQQAGEATPPTISLFVYNAPEAAADDTRSRHERLLDWAEANQALTKLPERGSLSEVKIDGLTAYTYTVEAEFPRQVYLAAYKGKYYLFVGQYEEAGDARASDFARVVDSILFF